MLMMANAVQQQILVDFMKEIVIMVKVKGP